MGWLGAALGETGFGGKQPDPALRRRRRVAAVTSFAAAATLTALAGCATTAPGPLLAIDAELAAGLDLYASGEFDVAARRFSVAAGEARRDGRRELERQARAAECTAWLRARRIDRFSRCTDRLEELQRRARRSDPGVNTLFALGAIAGERPPPRLRIPRDVQPLLRAASGEGR